MTTKERDIQCLRGIAHSILTFEVVCLASCLLAAPGWPSRHRSDACLTGSTRAIGTPARPSSAKFSALRDVSIGLLNRKIQRIDARLARSHDPKERARLLQMRQQLKKRIAH